MGSFADKGQESNLPAGSVASSLIAASECSAVIRPISHDL